MQGKCIQTTMDWWNNNKIIYKIDRKKLTGQYSRFYYLSYYVVGSDKGEIFHTTVWELTIQLLQMYT